MVSGDYTGGATPVPIPNTEVKPSRVDGTAGETLWESRTSPEFFPEMPSSSSIYWAFHFFGPGLASFVNAVRTWVASGAIDEQVLAGVALDHEAQRRRSSKSPLQAARRPCCMRP